MPTLEIKTRSGEVIYSGEATSLRELVMNAVKDRANLSEANLFRANLSRANLSEANLSEANLSEANLSEANLSRANLSEANLSEANLSEANLSRANLSEANLSEANLSEANLSRANLSEANLSEANLSEANLSRANLSEANLSRANLSEANGLPDKAAIINIHAVIYEAASKPDALDMSTWHKCKTTHCRAGWAVTLAGTAGAVLEELLGTNTAASLIYQASDPTLERVPDWFASNEDALADMKRLAEVAKVE